MNHITYITRFISPFPRWRQTNETKIIFIYFVNLFQVFTTGFDLFTDYRHETGRVNVLPDPEPFIGKCLGIRHCRTPRPWVSGSGTGPRDTSFLKLVILGVSVHFCLPCLQSDSLQIRTVCRFLHSVVLCIKHAKLNVFLKGSV